MPSLSYKKKFAPLVESGDKRHTIRAFRKDGKDPKPGDTLYHFTGLRTKDCRRLDILGTGSNETTCVATELVEISRDGGCVVAGKKMSAFDVSMLAYDDGFREGDLADRLNAFFDFFENRMPFRGLLIKW